MDWQKIKEKCPKALEELTLNTSGSYSIVYAGERYDERQWSYFLEWVHDRFNQRDLYDFFDGQKLIGWVFPQGGFWNYCIDDISFEPEYRKYMDRPAAEDALFENEFQILEERLK